MRQSVTDLIDVILQKIEECSETPINEIGIRTWLSGQGYAKRDIEDAIKLVAPRIGAVPSDRAHSYRTHRTFTYQEEYKLTRGARGALLRLEQYGLITPFEREMVLDRLHQFDGEVGTDELDYLLSWVVYGSRDVETQQTIYSILEGNGETLH